MGKRWQGVFLFNDWLDALNELPPKTAMTIINNIRQYIMEGIEPPPMRGQANIIQRLMLACEQRSKQASEYGRRGAEIKRSMRGDEGTQSPRISAQAKPADRWREGAGVESHFTDPLDTLVSDREMTEEERLATYARLLQKKAERERDISS